MSLSSFSFGTDIIISIIPVTIREPLILKHYQLRMCVKILYKFYSEDQLTFIQFSLCELEGALETVQLAGVCLYVYGK